MINNIFSKPYISFHGIGELDFTKLKGILQNGILPNIMLPNIKIRNELLGHNDTRVWLTKSPVLVGDENAKAYRAYVQNSIGIAVKLFPMDAGINVLKSFPDAGFVERGNAGISKEHF